MDGFFKAEGGTICEYDEMKPRSLYRSPFYKENEKDLVDVEARRYLFWSNDDYKNVKRILQGLQRTLVPVSIMY